MKIYSTQETDLQAATNQSDYELVVEVYHKMNMHTPCPQLFTLFIGLFSTSKDFSNFVQTVLLPCVELRHFKGKAVGYSIC